MDIVIKKLEKDFTNVKTVQLPKYATKKDFDFMNLKVDKKMNSTVYDEFLQMTKKLASEEDVSDIRSMVFRTQEMIKTKVSKQEYLDHF